MGHVSSHWVALSSLDMRETPRTFFLKLDMLRLVDRSLGGLPFSEEWLEGGALWRKKGG